MEVERRQIKEDLARAKTRVTSAESSQTAAWENFEAVTHQFDCLKGEHELNQLENVFFRDGWRAAMRHVGVGKAAHINQIRPRKKSTKKLSKEDLLSEVTLSIVKEEHDIHFEAIKKVATGKKSSGIGRDEGLWKNEKKLPHLCLRQGSVNRELRELKAFVSNNNHVNDEELQDVQRRIKAIVVLIETEFQDVKRNLLHEDSGIWAFIPQEEDAIMSLDESLRQKSSSREGSANWTFMSLYERLRKIFSRKGSANWTSKRQEDDIMKSYENLTHKTEAGLTPETSRDEILEIAIDSVVHYVSKCIKHGIIGKIGISGLGGEKVASALKDMQMVISKCSVVLCISVSRHHSIEEECGPITCSFFLCHPTNGRPVSQKECHGHLCAIVLLARALKGVTNIGVWELALNQLASQSSHGKSQVMVHVLKFFWDQEDIITKRCVKNCTHRKEWNADSLVTYWIENGLVETGANGKVILQKLINSFLPENLDYGCGVQMHLETLFVLTNFFTPSGLPRQGGLGLTETPSVEDWIDSCEIKLMNNELSELPENPKCPFLKNLLLHSYDRMEIPQIFFKDMPHLTHLDLSYTSIESLPPSIVNLKSLQKLLLRGCELLMALPPHIKALENLEKFDLEGTKIMYLPKQIGKLINLRCFKVSFCQHANRCKETKQMDTTIPTGVLSKLNRLRELRIDVNLDGEWWDADVKVILNELSSLKSLSILELHLPSAELLQRLRRDSTKCLLYFRFTVGRHRQRIISRLPHEVEEIFKGQKKRMKCLEYIYGEGIPTEITEVLNHANFFFLDSH
ncbi:putative disease resistance protein [Camellia lanceoleosa]|uniref:Disease resistance protein n=1 Tax=Camellia lanceoleosa TaxID=1840588 RepID=A0ACC0IRV5_9ERIC|nr:putative disease resistance protein [Camellia lanceoleosa]